MRTNHCKICYNKFDIYEHNRRIYCSDQCYDIAKRTDNRIKKQRLVFQHIKDGKTCKRCLKHVHEKGMREYCTKCRTEFKADNKYPPKKEIIVKNLCEKCHKKPKWSNNSKTKYCLDCKKLVQKEQSRQKTEELKQKLLKDRKNNKVVKNEKPIDPKWTKNRGSGRRKK